MYDEFKELRKYSGLLESFLSSKNEDDLLFESFSKAAAIRKN